MHNQLKLPQGDLLIHAGDMTMRGRQDEVVAFLRWFAAQPFRHRLLIAGNHDFLFEKLDHDAIASMIPEEIIYLNDSGVELEGLRIWGSPITPSYFDWAFNRHRGAAIQKHWALIPADTDLLITHGPVYGFLDLNMMEEHVGCQDLLRKVLTIKPRAHVCGHIHESYGSIIRSNIRFVNASLVNENYELVRPPVVFSI